MSAGICAVCRNDFAPLDGTSVMCTACKTQRLAAAPPSDGVCNCVRGSMGVGHSPNCAAVAVVALEPTCKRCGADASHPHSMNCAATVPVYGDVSPEMAAAKKLVAEKDAEIADLKRQRAAIGKLHDEAHADSCRAYNELIPEKDAEIARLKAAEQERCEGRAGVVAINVADLLAARALLARCRPILADYAHHPEIAELLTDVRRFLEPEAPAAPKPKSAADVVLASVFGPATNYIVVESEVCKRERAMGVDHAESVAEHLARTARPKPARDVMIRWE